jgi:hypothetical protein
MASLLAASANTNTATATIATATTTSNATIFVEMGGARKLQQILTKALAISNLPLPKQNGLMKIKEILKILFVYFL